MFEKLDPPLFCTQIQETTPTDAIATALDAIKRGTDVIGLQLCVFEPKYRTEEVLRQVFSAVKDVPVYLTDYRRFDKWGTFSWEEKERELLMAALCGASLIDVPGNMFSEDAFELTYDEKAVLGQTELISKIHKCGKKVLMSTHILKFTAEADVLKIAVEQENRGADVIKIVTACNTEDELLQTLETTRSLYKTLKKPFVFVASGEKGLTHRLNGPFLGSCLWLCAPKYGKYDTAAQPLLETAIDFRNAHYNLVKN